MRIDKRITITFAILGFLAAAWPAAPARAEDEKAAARVFKTLTAGRYACVIEGMLCRTCAKILKAEIAKLPEVLKASADFDTRELRIQIKEEKTLAMKKLKKALARASKRNNLIRFRLISIRYLP